MDFLYDTFDGDISLNAGNRSCRGSSYIQQEYTYRNSPYYQDFTKYENVHDSDKDDDGYIKLHLPFDFLYHKKTIDKLYISPYGYLLLTSTSHIDMKREMEQNGNFKRRIPNNLGKNENEATEDDLDHYYTQYTSPSSSVSAPFSASFPPVSTYFIAAHKYDKLIDPENYKVGINTDNSTYFWIRFEAQIKNQYYVENKKNNNKDLKKARKELEYLTYEYELLFTVENMLEIRVGSLASPIIKHYTTGVKDSNRILLENLPVQEGKSFVVIHDIYSVSLYNNYYIKIDGFDQPEVFVYYDMDQEGILSEDTKLDLNRVKRDTKKTLSYDNSIEGGKEKRQSTEKIEYEEKFSELEFETGRQNRKLGMKTYPPSPSPTPLPSPFEDCYDFVNNLTPPNNEANHVYYRSCQHKFGDDYRCECEWEVW